MSNSREVWEKLAFYPWEQRPFPEWTRGVELGAEVHALLVDTLPGNGPRLAEILENGGAPGATRTFLSEVCFFRWGYWRELYASLDENPHPEASGELALERRLLRFLCRLREGGETFGSQEEKELARLARVLHAHWVPAILEFEYVGARVRSGHYRENLGRLEKLAEVFRSPHAASAYWGLRVCLVHATALQALGNYRASTRAIKGAFPILRKFPSVALKAPLLRRRISLAIESECYEEAKVLLPEALELTSRESLHTERALLLQELLRTVITEGNDAAIDETFALLEVCVREAGLPSAFMSLVEERCELALRGARSEQALRVLEGFVDGARARGESAGVCVGLMYEARALFSMGRKEEAQAHLDSSLALARAQAYGKARVRILFYASAVALSAGAGVKARLLLHEAGELATELGLPVQILCHHFASDFLETGRPRLAPLVRALSSLPAFTEAFHYLRFYGFLSARSVRVAWGEAARELKTLEAYLAEIRSSPAVHWLAEENLLLSCGPVRSPVLLELDVKFPVDAAVAFLLRRGGGGASSAQLHALSYRNVPYKPELHGARVRMLVSRARARIKELGCGIAFSREGGCYFLRATSPLLTVFLVGDKRAGRRGGGSRVGNGDGNGDEFGSGDESLPLTPREREILALLGKRGGLGTATLCAQLGVTRQTLHPWLRNLCDKGLVTRKGRARACVYSLSGSG